MTLIEWNVTHHEVDIFLKFSIRFCARREQHPSFPCCFLCGSSHVKFNMRRKCVGAHDTIYFGFASFVVETLHNLQLSTLLTQSVQIARSLATCPKIGACVSKLGMNKAGEHIIIYGGGFGSVHYFFCFVSL